MPQYLALIHSNMQLQYCAWFSWGFLYLSFLQRSNSRLCGQGSSWWGKWHLGEPSALQKLFIQWRHWAWHCWTPSLVTIHSRYCNWKEIIPKPNITPMAWQTEAGNRYSVATSIGSAGYTQAHQGFFISKPRSSVEMPSNHGGWHNERK